MYGYTEDATYLIHSIEYARTHLKSFCVLKENKESFFLLNIYNKQPTSYAICM